MPGTNAGTGMPLHFMCSECRKHKYGFLSGERRSNTMLGTTQNVKLTGRKRVARPLGRDRLRNSHHTREYYCRKCGHVGWSRHIDLERKEKSSLI